MYAQRLLTPRIPENLDRIPRIRVHGRHDPPRHIRSDRNESQIKRTAKFANISESRTMWEVGVFFCPVVFPIGGFGHGAVAGIAAEEDGFSAGGDGPGGPEGGGAVVDGARGDVLAGEAGYLCDDGVFGGF